MPKYRIANLVTKDFEVVVMPNKKAAHEFAQTRWPGTHVIARSPEEHAMVQHTRWFYDQVVNATSEIERLPDEVTDLQAIRGQLDRIDAYVVNLRQVIEDVKRDRAQASNESVSASPVVGEGKAGHHEP